MAIQRLIFCSVVSVWLMSMIGCAGLNQFQRSGDLSLAGLEETVTVRRDEKGMAYIYAGNRHDALMAYGFITAQDRLFQMELVRRLAQGRIGEMAGEKALALDRRMRTIGFHRQAKRHAVLLDGPTRRYFQSYLDGVNTYIRTMQDEWPLEFKLAGLEPTPWEIADSLSLAYYMSWNSAANLKTEIIMQMLVERLGPERAMELLPLNINPDEANPEAAATQQPLPAATGITGVRQLAGFLEPAPLQVGSNNWAVAPDRTTGGKAILANDPHLDARMLPGPWYPAGIILPGFRIVGVGIPGLPSMVVFRTNHIAVGVTNSYADAQDLYVETVDPEDLERYMEGDASLAFSTVTETIRIKDKKAPDGFRDESLTIRSTRRGPVVSDVFPDLETERVLTLRWAPFETMGPRIALQKGMFATSADSFRKVLADVNWLMLNFVFADVSGNIGWVSSGRVPVRQPESGTVPFEVTSGKDNWIGWIPFDHMPQVMNPKRGWVGTCNHKTVTRDYPYYLSSYFASSYRYERLRSLLDGASATSARDHWAYQLDTYNTMAARLAPVFARILKRNPGTKDLGMRLEAWDFRDDPGAVAPTIFQETYRQLALMTFQDELGPELAGVMLKSWYFWQERFQKMVLEENSAWFDDRQTSAQEETMADLVNRAGMAARTSLSERYGADPDSWAWGRGHRIEFTSPIRRTGFGKRLMGGGAHPYPGSGETLYRGIYRFDKPFDVTVSAALRMVVDFSDPDRIMAVLPGGASGRVFHPHYKDQLDAFVSGEPAYWWFSDKAIEEHTEHVLLLTP